jgi:DNA-binding PadR family transcriptional regulator
MRSPLNWALLGLLIQRPSYGYELVQRFERTYADALELSSPSQIYTALDMLARRSLIEELPAEEAAPGVGRQPKPHYRATAEGVHNYQEWLIAHVGEESRRSRLFTCQLAALAPPVALAVIERYEQACLREAGRTPLANTHKPLIDDEHSDHFGLADRLVWENDRLAMGARLEWIEYARRELSALATGRILRR